MTNEIQIPYVPSLTLYVLIYNLSGLVWDGSVFVAYLSVNRGSYAIPLAPLVVGGSIYAANFPSGIPAGDYYNVAYMQLGGSPAEIDIIAGQEAYNQKRELSAVPAPAPGTDIAIQFLYQALRNKMTATAALQIVTNDAGATVGTAVLSDDGTTFTRGAMS